MDKQILSASEVLDLIDPVDPDNLQHFGNGVYVAKWHPPVLMLDVEMLMNTSGVQVVREPYEPSNLPGWLAIHFAIAG